MKVAFESVPSEFVSQTAFYDCKEPVTESLANISKNSAVIVTKDGEYYGIVDSRTVGRKGVKIGKGSPIGKFAVKVPTLDSSTSIEKAVFQFYHSGSKALPYYEGKKITGIVKRGSILKAILSLHLLSKYKMKEVMSTPIMAVAPETQVSAALAIMNKNNISRLVVMSGTTAQGMLTYKTILQELGSLSRRPTQMTGPVKRDAQVGQIIEREPISIEQEEGVEDGIRSLIENDVSALLVRKAGRPVGMATIRDIFEAVTQGSSIGTEENIVISGLDEWTSEYREEILAELEKLEDKVNRFHKLGVDSITCNVKRHRARNYEIKLRVWLAHRGVVSAAASGFSLSNTLEDTVTKVYNAIKEKKEIVYSEHRVERRGDEDAE